MKNKNTMSPHDMYELMAEKTGLTKDVDIFLVHHETEKKWNIVITRQGYRLAATREATYSRHTVYPIYDNSNIAIDGDKVVVTINGAMSNLMGAIGFLWKKDMSAPYVHQVDIEDYRHIDGAFWKSMPCTMLTKVCEVGLFRLAYPELFSGTYEKDEIDTGYTEGQADDEKLSKKEMVRYIRANIETARGLFSNDVRLDDLTMEEITKIYNKTLEEKDES